MISNLFTIENILSWPNRVAESLKSYNIIELTGLLTLALLTVYNYEFNWLLYIVPSMLVCAIVYRPVLFQPLFWGGLALIATYSIWDRWHPVANHKFLTTYWLWALTFATWVHRQSPEKAFDLLEYNAKFLVLFTMFGACVQKLLSPTYMDGSFFEMALLTESYFGFMLQTLQVDPVLIELTNNTIANIHNPNVELNSLTTVLPITPTYHYFALFVTAWNLGMQMILEFFGLFKNKKCRVIFHISMLIFLHSTYIAAPFIGFGWLLCIMLYTFTRKQDAALSTLYLLSIPVLILYASPWREALF